jgi:hypothetical protein
LPGYLVETPPPECADEFRFVQHIQFKLPEFGLLYFRYNARRLDVFGFLGDFFPLLGALTRASTGSHVDGSRLYPTILTFGRIALCSSHHSQFPL